LLSNNELDEGIILNALERRICLNHFKECMIFISICLNHFKESWILRTVPLIYIYEVLWFKYSFVYKEMPAKKNTCQISLIETIMKELTGLYYLETLS
jgi:hypothetical protein